MDLNILTRDADDLIRKVVSRYNQLYVPAGKISQVELDLMLDDMRKLYDTFKTIGQINLSLQNNVKKPEVSVTAATYKEPQQAATTTPENIENQAVTPAANEAVLETNEFHEHESSKKEAKATESLHEPELIAELRNEQPSPIEHETEQNTDTLSSISLQTQKPDSSSTTLADKFSQGNKSLSETIALSQEQNVMASRMQLQPIADLNTGIGLNDKFSFVSELFGNNPTVYDEAINRINKAVNLTEANWILQKYHNEKWNQQEETLFRLKDFVKRRFI